MAQQLEDAVDQGDARSVREHLRSGMSPNHMDINTGRAMLYLAAGNNKVDTVDALLEAGAKPNFFGLVGADPLHYAALEGHLEVVEMLLAHGALPNIKCRDEETLGAPVGTTPLQLAVSRGHLAIVRALLKAGARPNNCITREGYPPEVTPLHTAAERGDANIVRELLAAGADVEARDALKSTPLHYLARQFELHNSTHAETARALLAANSDLNAKDSKGFTPTSIAAIRNVYHHWTQLLDEMGRERNNGELSFFLCFFLLSLTNTMLPRVQRVTNIEALTRCACVKPSIKDDLRVG
jgi:ankyrin repeat protein